MCEIHDVCRSKAEQYGSPGDYLAGANIAGFERVAEAMLAHRRDIGSQRQAIRGAPRWPGRDDRGSHKAGLFPPVMSVTTASSARSASGSAMPPPRVRERIDRGCGRTTDPEMSCLSVASFLSAAGFDQAQVPHSED
jgi:hypothetical protein